LNKLASIQQHRPIDSVMLHPHDVGMKDSWLRDRFRLASKGLAGRGRNCIRFPLK
jgi:hypothetical protein